MNVPKARYVFMVVATLTLAANAFAGEGLTQSEKHIQTLTMKNFRQSLNSDIQGVVEGIMFDVVLYKKKYPTLDYNAIIDRLNNLAVKGEVPLVRYKAHLASMYLSYGKQFDIVPVHESGNDEDVFKQIAEQLEKNLLSANLSGSTESTR